MLHRPNLLLGEPKSQWPRSVEWAHISVVDTPWRRSELGDREGHFSSL